MEEFVYMAPLLGSKDYFDKEIRSRIALARNSMTRLERVWKKYGKINH